MTPQQRSLAKLARDTERQITALWAREQQGAIPRSAFVTASSALLLRARIQGIALADLGLAVALSRKFGRAVPPLGLTLPPGELPRLEGSVRTVLDQQVASATSAEELRASRAARLGRLGRDVAGDALGWAMRTAMTERKVHGWTRGTGPDPCEVCSNLADGSVMSPVTQMIRHTGCTCVPIPV